MLMFLSWLALAEVPESVRPIAAPSYAADDYGHLSLIHI